MNDLSFFIVAISCVVIGALMSWIIRKLLFEKNYVASDHLSEVNEKLQNLLTDKAVLNEKCNAALVEKEFFHNKLSEIESTNADLIRDNSKKMGIVESLVNEKEILITEISQLKTDLKDKTEGLNKALVSIADKDAKIQYQEEKQIGQKRDLDEMGEKLKKDFQLLANSIFDEKSQKFTQVNSESLKNILDPLKKDLVEFKTKVEETYDKESKQRFSLGEKIKDLVDLNHKISDEANNLTRALKGEVKKQGDWGEMILESVLENSGLQKDREYFIQAFIRDEAGNIIKNEEGQGMKPDVLIYYPDKRCLVVDAKVSLTAYDRFANSDEKETQELELNNHLNSMRGHIDGLSKKNYQNYFNSIDWVIMFVPIEPAYLVALRKDPELWYYAYSKKIILVCPSNLMAVLKITSDLWKREYQNQNAMEIAKRGGQLYDKFANFINTMQELGGTITKAQATYDKAFRQLTTGSGNLVRQAEMMRKLEIKATKKLPEQIINEAMDAEVVLRDDENNEPISLN